MTDLNKLNTSSAGGVIISACSLWKHIACLSLIIFILSAVKNFNLSNGALILFLICQFECLRLNLDSHLFKVFYTNLDELDNIDEGIWFLFNKKNKNRTIEDRWRGTKKILIKSVFWLFVQIIFAFIV